MTAASKPTAGPSKDTEEDTPAANVAADDPKKVEKLTKAGRDLDPDEGAD